MYEHKDAISLIIMKFEFRIRPVMKFLAFCRPKGRALDFVKDRWWSFITRNDSMVHIINSIIFEIGVPI